MPPTCRSGAGGSSPHPIANKTGIRKRMPQDIILHMSITLTLLTVAGFVVFLTAEKLKWQAGRWLSKPVASAAFVGVALANGASATPFGRWIVAALVFSWLGDVLLIPKSTFLAGLGSFLVGHLLFAAAFL